MSNIEKNSYYSSQNFELKITSEQEKNFSIFLKTKEKEEQRKLTANEIEKLKQEFLEKQNKNLNYIKNSYEFLEGTKFEKNFGSKENFEKFTKAIDSGVFGYFFGETGILKNLNISENEKKSFSASTSIYLMDLIYNEIKKTGNFGDIEKEILESFGKNFKGLNNSNIILDFLSGDIINVFGKIYNENKINLISESLLNSNLKNNKIFSTPKETFDFFENISKNNLNKEKIINLIESKNSDFPAFGNKNDLKNIGEKIGSFVNPGIGKALGNIYDISNKISSGQDFIKNGFLGNREITESLSMLSSIPVIGNFIKMVLDFLGLNLEDLNSGLKEKIEKVKNSISKKDSFLEGVNFSQNFAKNKNGNDDFDFVHELIFISGNTNENNFEEDLEKLFKKGSDFENFIKNKDLKILPNFSEKNILQDNNGNLIFENLKYFTNLYKDFLENKNNGINSVKEFVNLKIKENQKLNEQIFAGTKNFSENKNSKKTETEQKTLETKEENSNKKETKENKDLIINGAEGIEINNERARYIFNLNGKKYEISAWSNGYITLVKDKNKKVVYQGGQDFFKYLNKFNGKLDKQAEASDFGKNVGPINPNLGDSIGNILINGYKDEKGFKDLIPKNFFNNGQIIEGNINLIFGDNNYNLSLAQRK